MPESGIDIKADYVKKDGEMLMCAICKDPIFGYRYNLELTIGQTVEVTNLNYCQSCFDMNKLGTTE